MSCMISIVLRILCSSSLATSHSVSKENIFITFQRFHQSLLSGSGRLDMWIRIPEVRFVRCIDESLWVSICLSDQMPGLTFHDDCSRLVVVRHLDCMDRIARKFNKGSWLDSRMPTCWLPLVVAKICHVDLAVASTLIRLLRSLLNACSCLLPPPKPTFTTGYIRTHCQGLSRPRPNRLALLHSRP